MNFVTSPAVSLSAACFASNRFEDANSADCISNLLAVGFRRLSIDLYYDEGRALWSFCPVALPTSISSVTSVSAATQPTRSSLSVTATSVGTPSSTPSASLSQRQENESLTQTPTSSDLPTEFSSATGSVNALNGSSISSSEALPSISPYLEDPDTPLVSIGPYTCTTSINLSTLITQLRDYFVRTDDTVNASLLYVYFNLHAASPTASPLASASAPTKFPGEYGLLGSVFRQSISDWIYTPDDLAANRRDVNGTWLTVSERYRPADEFYNVMLNEFDQGTTEDGWPSESYIEFSRRKRLLLSWGTIDPQMSGYNFSGDASTIFHRDFTQRPVNVSITPTNQVLSGCFLRPSTEDIQVAAVNSSWATTSASGLSNPTSPGSDLTPLLNLTSSLISCGISPVLNTTLLNVTARQDFRPYQAFVYSSIWSWAPTEPQSFNSSGDDTIRRCALTSTSRQGRWIVEDCNRDHFAACRASRQPYNWTISTNTVSYESAEDACPTDYEFAAPRTALENSFLTQAMNVGNKVDSWVDFNSIDRPDCWVMGGADAECPYKEVSWDQDYNRRRAILVCISGVIF